ncbi:MAG: hypothetical protein NC412_07900 [Roseburia sp.]|nr:hypothetical protein [Roseburia sp.]MCM1278656.1 hypothetical protein [Robinsoniella sp.]
MGYQDERILKAKKELKEQEKKKTSQEAMEKEAEESIYDEVTHIIGKEVTFRRRSIPELGISIYMPETFFRFADDISKLIYPAGKAPDHVFGGEEINFQMSLEKTVYELPASGMKGFISMAGKMLEAAGPRVRVIEKKVEKIGEDDVGILSFVSKAVDTMVYNIQFYADFEGGLLVGNIHFPSKYKKRLIPLAKEVIYSMEMVKED